LREEHVFIHWKPSKEIRSITNEKKSDATGGWKVFVLLTAGKR
jgi:hypothetical protein